MAHIPYKLPWESQPQEAVTTRPVWSNVWLPSAGFSDLVGGVPITSQTLLVNAQGVAYGGGSAPAIPSLNLGNSFTTLSLVLAPSGNFALGFCGANYSTGGYELAISSALWYTARNGGAYSNYSSVPTLTARQYYLFSTRQEASGYSTLFVNGKKYVTAGSVGTNPIIATQMDSTSGFSAAARQISLRALCLSRLSDDEIVNLHQSVWDGVFAPRSIYIPISTGGGTNTAINPAAGSVTITGQVPTIDRTANQAVTPSAGSLTITGYAPTITASSGTDISPAAGSLTITGQVPTVSQSAHQSVSPAAGSITVSGYAPSITVASASREVTPNAGSLTIIGYAPTIVNSGELQFGGGAWFPNIRRKTKKDDPPEEEVSVVVPAKRPTLTLAKLVGPKAANELQAVADQQARKIRRRKQQEILLLM